MRPREVTRLLLRLALFVPLAAALILIDWASLQPPVQRRVGRPLEAAVDALIAGKTIWSTTDIRDLKPVWMARVKDRRDVLVLGASRVIQIPEEWFRPRSMLNGAVSGGDLDDMVAIFEMRVESGKTPSLVLLDLNPSLTLAQKPSAAPLLAFYLRRALVRYRIYPPRLLPGIFFGDALRGDFRYLMDMPAWGIADGSLHGGYRLRPDGTEDWDVTDANATPAQVESIVDANLHHLTPAFEQWRTGSQPAYFDLKILRAFLDDLQSRGIRVIVLLAPLHPAAYDFYTSRGGYNESWIRREMAGRGIQVIGSYSPAAVKVTGADFFDDMHPHPEVLRRLLREAGVI